MKVILTWQVLIGYESVGYYMYFYWYAFQQVVMVVVWSPGQQGAPPVVACPSHEREVLKTLQQVGTVQSFSCFSRACKITQQNTRLNGKMNS